MDMLYQAFKLQKILLAGIYALFDRSFLVAAFVIPLTTSSLGADLSRCDQGLRSIGGNLGYQLRSESNVCEGLYESNVSASLEIVSFLDGKLSFDPKTEKALKILVVDNPLLGLKEVSVRAVSLYSGTYYRLDSALVQPESLNWSLNEVIGPAELTLKNLGVFGWIGSESNKTFVPLRVAPAVGQSAERDGQSFELLIRPTVDLDFIVWRAWTEDGTSAGNGRIPRGARAGWPFPISIASGPPAILEIEVTAKKTDRDENAVFRISVVRAP